MLCCCKWYGGLTLNRLGIRMETRRYNNIIANQIYLLVSFWTTDQGGDDGAAPTDVDETDCEDEDGKTTDDEPCDESGGCQQTPGSGFEALTLGMMGVALARRRRSAITAQL